MKAESSVTLVLLPGMDGTGLLFTPFLRGLPAWVKPQVVSYPDDRPLDYAGLLEYLLAALPKDEPFVLLGESFSGPLALMAAARRPEGLKGVILCATFVDWPLALPPLVIEVALLLGIFRLKSFQFMKRLLLGGSAGRELERLFFEALERPTPQVLAARGRAVCRLDCRQELRDCPVPVLALIADRDRIVTRRSSGLFQQLRPDMEIAHFDSAHLILQLATEAAVERVCRFMAQVRSI